MSAGDEHEGEPVAQAESPVSPAQPSIVPLVLPRVSLVPVIRERSSAPSTPPARESLPPVGSLPRESLPPEAMHALEAEIVRQLRTGRAALPVLPRVAESALRLANDPEARIDELARLVDTDPPIAARFMSVANSVAYWRGMLAASTQTAIVRLGLANTRDLLFQVVYATSTHGLKKYQSVVQRSFKRSVVTAIAARVTAQAIGYAGEYDYMSGLLHDIGEARVYRILDNLNAPVDDRALIQRLVQKYHCVAGAEIAMAWKLPTEIVDACAAHHEASAADNSHVRLVMIADRIAEGLDRVAAGQKPPFAELEALGIDIDLARALMDRTESGVGVNKASLRP